LVGRAEDLDTDVELPDGVSLRQITEERDVRAMCLMTSAVFGDESPDEYTDALVHRLSLDDGMQIWVAEAQGAIVSAGRLEPLPDSDFAGIWGGATIAGWRRRGIDRALTAQRARSALSMGKTLIHSDSTADSRPILERSGFSAVSTTTPYLWRR
jgi:ribosomal protein S18 acetylase RimI-like enzyme